MHHDERATLPTAGKRLGSAERRPDELSKEDLDDLAVRRELAAASVAALGDFWDDEVDAQWQDFQP